MASMNRNKPARKMSSRLYQLGGAMKRAHFTPNVSVVATSMQTAGAAPARHARPRTHRFHRVAAVLA